MVRFPVLLSLLLLLSTSIAQKLEWAIATEGGWSIGHCVRVSPDGNVVVAGGFRYTVDFDPDSTIYNLTSNYENSFFAKYSTSGNLIWANSLRTTLLSNVDDMIIDNFENIYLIGGYRDTIDLDPGPGNAIFISPGSHNIYLAKYNKYGQYIWGFDLGSSTYDWGGGIDLDSNGNIYITGRFSGTVDFDPGLGTTDLQAVNNSDDIFLAKYNNIGGFLWAISMGGQDYDVGTDLEVDKNGDIIVMGTFESQANFNPAGTTVLNSNGSKDIFLAKYSSGANLIWAKKIGGVGSDYGSEIHLDNLSNIFITGSYSYSVDFDPGANSASFTSEGGFDIFIAKYNSLGNYLWVNSYGGTDNDGGVSISTFDTILYSSGAFRKTVDFDSLSNDHIYTSPGTYRNMFFNKHNHQGNHKNTIVIGDYLNDGAYSLRADVSGNIYLTGRTTLKPDFDPGCDTFFLPQRNSYVTFLMKFNPCIESFKVSDSVSVCSPTTYFFPDGDSSDVSTIDTSCLSTFDGCDSLIITYLTINSINSSVTQSGNKLTSDQISATYQWLKCDSSGYSEITNATGQSYTPGSNGDYAVIVTKNGCSDTSECKSITWINVDEFVPISDLRIYPNPTNGEFTIELGETYLEVSVKITNPMGQVISITDYQNSSTIQQKIEGAPGVYLIIVSADDGVSASFKVLKE